MSKTFICEQATKLTLGWLVMATMIHSLATIA